MCVVAATTRGYTLQLLFGLVKRVDDFFKNSFKADLTRRN